MRVLKFRAWHKKLKIMKNADEFLLSMSMDKSELVKDALASTHAESFVVNMIDFSTRKWEREWKSLEIMQYTGLKDKNGVEIYEGDIVQHQCFAHQRRQAVVYKAPGFTVQPMKELSFSALVEICEVIGNIYENPELAAA